MFLLLQLKEMRLDSGTLGISQVDALLLFILILGITMVPYSFLVRSLGERKDGGRRSPSVLHRALDWMHLHRHPELLHH